MSYLDREETAGTRFFKKAGVVIFGVVAFAVAKTLFSGGSDYLERQTFSSDKVDTALVSDPAGGKAFLEMKTRFPDEYKRMTTAFSELLRNGASKDQMKQASFTAMRTFSLINMKNVASASDESLVSIARAQWQIANVLSAESQTLCAQFGMSGIGASDRPSASAIAALGEGTRLLIVAADEGSRHPKIREVNRVSDADSEALVTALTRNGLSSRQLEILGSSSLATASDEDKCEITRVMYESVAGMPPPASARWTAFMLSSSLSKS